MCRTTSHFGKQSIHSEYRASGRKGRILAAVVLISASLLLSACATRLTQFKNFSEAGVAYTGSTIALVGHADDVAIDADSTVLMKLRIDHSAEGTPKKPCKYKDRNGKENTIEVSERICEMLLHNNTMQDRVRLLTHISRHTQLLQAYFTAMANLAGSTAADDIATSTKGILDDLAGVRQELKAQIDGFKVGNETISVAIEPITKLVIGTFQQAKLEEELQKNGKTIANELALQEAVIKTLTKILKSDLKMILNWEEALYIDQFASANELPPNWPERRKSILTTASNNDSLADAASKAATTLKKTYVALVEQKLTAADIPTLARDINRVLDLIKLLKDGPSVST